MYYFCLYLIIEFIFFLGGLFDDGKDDENFCVFRYTIEEMNNQYMSYDEIPTLGAMPHKIKYGDEFEASKVVCDMFKVKLLHLELSISKFMV